MRMMIDIGLQLPDQPGDRQVLFQRQSLPRNLFLYKVRCLQNLQRMAGTDTGLKKQNILVFPIDLHYRGNEFIQVPSDTIRSIG